MTDSSPAARFVFDAPRVRIDGKIYSATRLEMEALVVVSDDALTNEVNGASTPNEGEYVTIAGNTNVIRGKVVSIAYLVEPEETS